MRLEALGDQGALARFDDEAAALRWAAAVRRDAGEWLLDVVQAYCAVAVFSPMPVGELMRRLGRVEALGDEGITGRLHAIPCCYELGPDLALVAEQTGMSADDVIRLHTSAEYTVYAIGFSPGFPYLGYLPPALCGVPRLASPRLRVEAGSVGLTGRQTGIYPEAKPGGWSLIGRTPLALVDVAAGYFPLRTGDRVSFVRIDAAEFARRVGERLEGG